MTGELPGRGALSSIILGLIEAEVSRQRGVGGLPLAGAQETLAVEMTLDEAGFGIDSLEQMGVRASIEEMFGSIVTTGRNDREALPNTAGTWADMVLRSWQDNTAALNVMTSGTTGAPKSCRHLVSDLMEEARYFAEIIGTRKRVVAFVPPQHIYGLIWTAILPELLEAIVIRAHANDLVDLLAGDLVVGVPHQWHALARRPSFPKDIIGVNAGGPLALDDANALSTSGLTRMLDVYGTSETGGIAFREAACPVYTLIPRWTFGEDGLGVSQLISIDGKMIPLPDRIVRIGDSFRLDGRHDGVVQVGGLNVSPNQIAQILVEHDGVAEAAVRLGGNGRLKAFLVPCNGRAADGLVEAVSQYAARQLPAHARPVSYRTGMTLPQGALGKALDWQ